jgi:acetoacetyl-CoA synthase
LRRSPTITDASVGFGQTTDSENRQMTVRITAMGGYVPEKEIGNDKIVDWTGSSEDWITKKTGIDTRRYADADTPTSALALRAVERLRQEHPGALETVSMILFATSTPDRPQPPTAAILQAALGLDGVPALDINSVCAGFPFGLQLAASHVERGNGHVLLVAADKYSGILDRTNRQTVSLLGDGAAAALIEPSDDAESGLRSLILETHGKHADYVTVPAGGSELRDSPDWRDFTFQMKGSAVKEYFLTHGPRLLARACAAAGLKLDEIATVIPHQGNVRLLEAFADAVGVERERVCVTADRWGNTGAASLPLTMLDARQKGRLTPGRPVALVAVGGGMSLAAGIYVP